MSVGGPQLIEGQMDIFEVLAEIEHDETQSPPGVEWNEIGPRFAGLIVAAHRLGARIFACDLALGGASAERLALMAHRWRAHNFEPAELADALMQLSDDITKL